LDRCGLPLKPGRLLINKVKNLRDIFHQTEKFKKIIDLLLSKEQPPDDTLYWYIDLKEDIPLIRNVSTDYFKLKDKVF